MTAQEARQISSQHRQILDTITLVDKLIVSEAEFGKRGTKIDINHVIIHVIRDHYKTNGFNVDVQSNNGVYTLYLGW